MADLTLKQKKEWAKLLYTKENLTQGEIAERVGVSRVTVNKWVNAEKWEFLKVSITLTTEQQIQNLFTQLSNLNKKILERDEGERFATPAEADSIRKLSKAIREMQTEVGLSEITSVFSDFLHWLRSVDPAQASDIAPTLDAFVKSKIP